MLTNMRNTRLRPIIERLAKKQAHLSFHPAKDEKLCFFTSEYEGKSFKNYLDCLMENNIKILCDVCKN